MATREELEALDRVTDEQIAAVMTDAEFDEAVDGCTVYELDGSCPHGYRGLVAMTVGF